jgi:UDP-glucose:glycoprotein glucosyltransferase
VQISVNAPWSPAPLIIEASEYFTESKLFWKYAEHVPADSLKLSDKDQHDTALALVEKILSTSHQGALRFALALRQYAPTMEVHRQLWQVAESAGCSMNEEDGAVVLVGSRCVSRVEDLDEAVQKCSLPTLQIHDAFDHIYPAPNSGVEKIDAILYASLGTKAFHQFHSALSALASKSGVRYVFRHSCAAWRNSTESSINAGLELQGYGVELAMKNMEYKAVDDTKIGDSSEAAGEEIDEGDVGGFDFKVLYERRPELKSELQSFRDTLLAEVSKSDENVKVWALKDLGIQASQRIMEAKEPLRLMRDLSHNLPTLVSSLSRLKVNMSMKSEIEGNHQFLQPGTNLVLLNGRQIDPETTTPFGLYSILRFEIETIEKLSSLGFSFSSARKLLVVPDPDRAARMMGAATTFKIDVMNADHIYWMNDLERDSRYRQWPNRLEALLQRGWPGQLRHVAKNLYTLIYLLDPSDKASGRYIREAMEHIENNLPARFGFIFKSKHTLAADDEGVVETEESKSGRELYNLFMALNDRHGKDAAFAFWSRYEQKIASLPFEGRAEYIETSRKEAFRAAVKGHKAKERDSEGKLIRAKYKVTLNTTEYDDRLKQSTRFVESTGLDLTAPVLVLNGVILQGISMNFESVMYFLQTQMANLQRMTYYGEIDERKSVYAQLVADKAYKRYHKYIVPGPDSSSVFLSLSDVAVKNLPFIDCGADTGRMRPISTIVAVDLASTQGQKLALDTLARLTRVDSDMCERVRLAFVYNGPILNVSSSAEADFKDKENSIEALNVIQMAMLKWKDRKNPQKLGEKLLKFAKKVIESVKQWENVRQSDDQVVPLLEKLKQARSAEGSSQFMSPESQVEWVRTSMKVNEGELAVACAGRLFKVSRDVPFESGDFDLAEGTEWKSRAEHVASVIEAATFDSIPAEDVTSEFLSDLALISCTVLGEQGSKDIVRAELPRQWRGQLTGFSMGAENSPLQITAIVDPLCLATQRLAPMLMTVAAGFNASIQVLLNPLSDVTALPIKGYFRYVLKPSLDFDEVSGKLRTNHRATFTTLPLNKLLSMVLHPPDAWFVEASACAHDVDNILLEKLPDHETVLSATYTLQHILVTGHCTDERNSPPAGLQLVLKGAQEKSPIFSDTMVMSNLGYFQLKAKPGVWELQAAEGRSRDLYYLKNEGRLADSNPILVASFEPQPVPLSVFKRAGFEGESLIVQDPNSQSQSNPSLWSSITNLFGESKQVVPQTYDPAVPSNETIHVFSLASGHLYERFLKIMILSVVRNTKARVKFWLLSNFLSPKFKDSIPKISRKYGFEYQLVTYKWPAWLHRQTEKQRIIWGYKILMLDVLFPLSVPKIIYIDSDQVVRADLRELWYMDLKGKALAYTPFCDSNREMEGYRFWKQGFWAGHLGHLKYHISALYVVDLVQFRAMGAGDQLRVVYSQLSRDPNSLANLDQDLPNYAQHSVQIHSLPQEWLWCETWCSNETKTQAKTIDLCNNPMTKEPKLDQARRIIAEWVDLDEAVKAADSEDTPAR